jgi:hypothetical protein
VRQFILWFFILAAAGQLQAQAGSSRQRTFQVSSAPAWTDTGLNFQAGDALKISVVSSGSSQSSSDPCDPAGSKDDSGNSSPRPVADARPGALIAKLEVDGPAILIGAQREVHVDKNSHLFLGTNGSGTTACPGGFQVSVQVTARESEGTDNGESKTRGAQLKSQLANAAQVFMSGQFGIKPAVNHENPTSAGGSRGTDANSAPVLHLSNRTLDADLRKQLDDLPRRVHDQFNNLGDLVNFVIIGSENDVQAALEAADWHIADTNNTTAVVNAVMETYDKKDYLAMPMSTLYLFGRKQDFGYEMADPIAMVASRHHFRIWKAPFAWEGQEVWVGAGTHDIGFARDKRNNRLTHKIDPAVDGERENIGISLQKSNKAKTFSYYLPLNPVEEARNATGDGYHSDGRILVVFLH